jgi:hypothetical protein
MTPEQIMAAAFQDELEKIASLRRAKEALRHTSPLTSAYDALVARVEKLNPTARVASNVALLPVHATMEANTAVSKRLGLHAYKKPALFATHTDAKGRVTKTRMREMSPEKMKAVDDWWKSLDDAAEPRKMRKVAGARRLLRLRAAQSPAQGRPMRAIPTAVKA